MSRVLEDLKKLKDVYNQIEDFKIGEELLIKMRILSSEDETEVHAFAMAYDQGLAYLFSVKRETITRSIIGLNGKEIPEFIEELNEKGEVEKIQRHVWLRKNIIKGWNQLLIDQVWNKYAILMGKIETKLGVEIKTEN